MSYFNYEYNIESQLRAQLEVNNQTFEVNTFYESAGSDSIAQYILGKVKSVPTVFLRCTGFTMDNLDTYGSLTLGNYNVEVICASNDAGKAKQIKTQERIVNRLCMDVIARLNSFTVRLTNQPSQPLVLQSVQDLFTIDQIDARVISLQLQGVVIDLNETALDNELNNII